MVHDYFVLQSIPKIVPLKTSSIIHNMLEIPFWLKFLSCCRFLSVSNLSNIFIHRFNPNLMGHPPRGFSAGKNSILKISICGFRLKSILDLFLASAKKIFQKIYSKGVPGGPKKSEKNFFSLFFQKLLRIV